MEFPNEIWSIIKDFMSVWKEHHKRKLNESFEMKFTNGVNKCQGSFWKGRYIIGIKTIYPKKLILEEYNIKTKLYHTAFRIPWRHLLEHRFSYCYDLIENDWSSKDN